MNKIYLKYFFIVKFNEIHFLFFVFVYSLNFFVCVISFTTSEQTIAARHFFVEQNRILLFFQSFLSRIKIEFCSSSSYSFLESFFVEQNLILLFFQPFLSRIKIEFCSSSSYSFLELFFVEQNLILLFFQSFLSRIILC